MAGLFPFISGTPEYLMGRPVVVFVIVDCYEFQPKWSISTSLLLSAMQADGRETLRAVPPREKCV